MDKSQLEIQEVFTAQSEEKRRENLQRAVDEYIRIQLQTEQNQP